MSTARIDAVIDEQFPGDEWAEVRRVVRAKVAEGTSPTRIGFDSALYRRIKDRLPIVADAMEAEGMFPPPLFRVSEVERVLMHQMKLADLAAAKGIPEDAPASPHLPAALTVAMLRTRAFPRLASELEAAWRAMGGRFSQGRWIAPVGKGGAA